MKMEKIKIKQFGKIDLMDLESYDILASLLCKGYSVTLNKLRIIKYIRDNPDISMHRISKDLKIDYKNTWRIIQELKKERILAKDNVSQGKKSKLKIKKSKSPTKEEATIINKMLKQHSKK